MISSIIYRETPVKRLFNGIKLMTTDANTEINSIIKQFFNGYFEKTKEKSFKYPLNKKAII